MSRSHVKFFNGIDIRVLEKEVNDWLESDKNICVSMFDIKTTAVTDGEGDQMVNILVVVGFHVHTPDDMDTHDSMEDIATELRTRKKTKKQKPN